MQNTVIVISNSLSRKSYSTSIYRVGYHSLSVKNLSLEAVSVGPFCAFLCYAHDFKMNKMNKMNSAAFISAIPVTSFGGRTSSATCTRIGSTSFAHSRPLPVRAARPTRCNVQMISAEVARNAIAVYGVVIAGGGIGAFLKSGSKPSIISGVVAGIVLAGAYVKDSVPLALGTAIALALVFAIRLVKTKKFIPAGMLCLASVAAAAFFAASLYA